MKQKLQGIIIGFIMGAICVGATAMAANTRYIEAVYNNIKIVVDGNQITPTDGNGNIVEPFISEGTTYLPVRAVANALGKDVSWDGNTQTVYIGQSFQGGSIKLENMTDISSVFPYQKAQPSELTDNYGNTYNHAVKYILGGYFETLCNSKYSRFTGTLYVKNGYNGSDSKKVTIEADGRTIYSSPEITKTSKPVYIDVNISGCNNFKIITDGVLDLYIGDAQFYY